MKKSILVAFLILLLPAASFAQEKMLYDIAEDTITLAEATINCAAPEGSCTESDGIALKADAKNSLRDIWGLMCSGDLRSMKFSAEQILYLSSRLESLASRLVHAEMFETACNLGPLFIYSAYMLYVLLVSVSWGLLGFLLVLICIVLSIVLSLIGSLLLLTCLFGWI